MAAGRCSRTAISTSARRVKAYFALKMIGDCLDAPHMVRAREALLARGGASRSNVFTRFLLALFGVMTWSSVPVMPVEIMLLPRWLPFHLDKISYWARTVLVPLLVLAALKPRARNPRGIGIDELFLDRPLGSGRRSGAAPECRLVHLLSRHGCCPAARPSRNSLAACAHARSRARSRSSTERLNGEDGLGAIYPAMANSVMMFDAARLSRGPSERAAARDSVDKLVVVGDDEAYCQPCVSPVWDTALVCHALLETGERARRSRRCTRPANGCCRGRCSTSKATGPASGRRFVPAAGRSNTTMPIIPISTIPRWW